MSITRRVYGSRRFSETLRNVRMNKLLCLRRVYRLFYNDGFNRVQSLNLVHIDKCALQFTLT